MFSDKKSTPIRLPFSIAVCIAVVMCCNGSKAKAVDLDVSVSLGTDFSDNARRVSTDETSERQDQYGLTIAADQRQGDVEFSVNYNARQSRFSKDTQDKRSTIDGESLFSYRASDNPFHLLVSHSRNRILERPQDNNLLANLDERTILTGVPGLQYRVSPVDQVNLDATVSRVSYRFDEQRDSKQKGLQLRWEHRLSSLDQLSLSLESIESEFINVDGFDYEYEAINIGYSAQLRRLSYNIALGYLKSSADQRDEVDLPNYSIDLTYRTGAHDFTLRGRRSITDTSLGNNNQGLLDNVSGGDGTSESFDRYKLTTIEANWDTPILCNRCNFNFALGFNSEKYIEDTVQNNAEYFGRMRLGYTISRLSQLDFSVRHSDQKFDSVALAEDFDQNIYELRFSYRFSTDARVQTYLRQEERSSRDSLNEYDVFVVGMTLTQTF